MFTQARTNTCYDISDMGVAISPFCHRMPTMYKRNIYNKNMQNKSILKGSMWKKNNPVLPLKC